MRISDWSSDVCSSDLCLVHHFEEVGSRCVALHCKARHTEHETGPFANSLLIIDEVYDALVPDSSPDNGSGYGDRTSVVAGKSVAVRVDLGGRSTIKNKNYSQLHACHGSNTSKQPRHFLEALYY